MVDFGIVLSLTGLYFFLILLSIVYARYKETRSFMPGLGEFFLAGKNLHPLILTATYVASLFSTFTILGTSGLAYQHGLGGALFIFIGDAAGLLFLYFVGRQMRDYASKHKVFSPLEIISSAYGSKGLGLVLAIIFTVFLIPYVSLQLVGIGAFIEAYTQGRMGYVSGVGAMMIIVFLYLFLGGMRAVAYTDFIQLIAMILGLFFGLFYILDAYDWTIPSLLTEMEALSPKHFSIQGPSGFYTWPMLITSGLTILGIYAQPHLLTRAIMARQDRDIYMMIMGTVLGRLLVSALALLFGYFAWVTYGGSVDPNQVMGKIFQDMANIHFAGLFLSGLMLMGALGAAMSTADSLLISIGQISTRDMIRPFFKMSAPKQVWVSKFIMFLVLVLAFVIGLKPPAFMIDLALYSGAGCTLLVPILIGYGWKKRSVLAAYLSIGIAMVLLIAMIAYEQITEDKVAPVHVGFMPMLVSFVLYFGLCLLRAKKKKQG